MALGAFVEELAEEGKGLEHIRLVDAGELAGPAARLAALRQAKRKLEQPLRGLARDHQRLARLVVRHHAFAHRGEQALGRLADEHEIDAAAVGADDRARHAGHQAGRAHAGIEIEDEAQFDLRHDLGAVRIAHLRQAAGAEQDRIRIAAQFHGGVGHRLAGVAIMAGAGCRFGELEFQPRRRRLDLAQHFKRRRHHLGADAVAGEDRDMERVVGEHFFPHLRGNDESGQSYIEPTRHSRRLR